MVARGCCFLLVAATFPWLLSTAGRKSCQASVTFTQPDARSEAVGPIHSLARISAQLYLEQMKFASVGDRLGAVGRGKFGKDMFHVTLRRVEADNEPIRDLL